MAYTVNVTEITPQVTATSVTQNITVTTQDAANFSITNTAYSFNVTAVESTVTMYENSVELKVDDFDNYFLGDWVNGATYTRGDIVNYANSLYVSNVATFTNYTSTIVPPNDLGTIGTPDSQGNRIGGGWRRVVWKESTFAYVNVTNTATIGNLVVNTPVAHLTVTNFTAGDIKTNTIETSNTATLYSLNVLTPMDHLTVTNQISAGSLTVGGANANGGVAIQGPLYIGGTSTFVGTATFLNDLNVGGSGQGFTVNSTATFNNNTVFNGTATFKNEVDLSLASVIINNLTVTNSLQANHFSINGLNFATTAGYYGQVLFTNGSNQANWTYIGDLTVWSLGTDLATNGFKIVSGSSSENLTIGQGIFDGAMTGGYITFSTNTNVYGDFYVSNGNTYLGTTNTHIQVTSSQNILHGTTLLDGTVIGNSNINFGSTINANYGANITNINLSGILNHYSGSTYYPVRIDGGITFTSATTGVITFTDGSTLSSAVGLSPTSTATTTRLGLVEIGSGIDISGAGVISLKPTTHSQIGGVKVGNGLIADIDGTLNVFTGYGLAFSSGPYGSGLEILNVIPATTNSIGGIIVGDNLTIDGNGKLSANPGGYTLPAATTSTLGGIKIGPGLSIDGNGVVTAVGTYTVSTATYTVLGGVKTGNGVYVDHNTGYLNVFFQSGSGLQFDTSNNADPVPQSGGYQHPIRLAPATSSTIGGVIVDGTTITVNGSGVISANQNGPVSLSAPLYTNGYNIQDSSSDANNYATINSTGVVLNSQRVGFSPANATLSLSGTNLNSTATLYNEAWVTDSNGNSSYVKNYAILDSKVWINSQNYNTYTDPTGIIITPDTISLSANRQHYGSTVTNTNSTITLTANSINLDGVTNFNSATNFNSTATFNNLNVSGTNVLISGTNVRIESQNSIVLGTYSANTSTATVVVGNDSYHSIIKVERIYNYDGAFGPAFPYGLQFGDGSYQVTAFNTSTLGQFKYDFGPIIGG